MNEILIGLKEIAFFLGTGIKSVRKWIDTHHLPAYRYSDGIYRASKKQVIEWVEATDYKKKKKNTS